MGKTSHERESGAAPPARTSGEAPLAAAPGFAPAIEDLLRLQRTAGNAAVAGSLARRVDTGAPGQQYPPPSHHHPPQSQGVARPREATHVVRKGDSLWRIAAAAYGNGKYWAQIYDANPKKMYRGGKLIVGATLHLPDIRLPIPERPTRPAIFASALETLFPVFECDLFKAKAPSIPPIRTPSGTWFLSFQLTGKVQLQRVGTCNPFTVNREGLKTQAEAKAGNLTTGVEVKNFDANNASISIGWDSAWGSSSASFEPPDALVYAAAPKMLPLRLTDVWQVKGKVGYQLKVRYIPNMPKPRPEPHRSWARRFWQEHADAIVVGAGALLVTASIVSEVATLGVSTEVSAPGFAAGMSMMTA